MRNDDAKDIDEVYEQQNLDPGSSATGQNENGTHPESASSHASVSLFLFA